MVQAGANKSRPGVNALWRHLGAANSREAASGKKKKKKVPDDEQDRCLLQSNRVGFFSLFFMSKNGLSVAYIEKSFGFIFSLEEEETSSCLKEDGVGPPSTAVSQASVSPHC